MASAAIEYQLTIIAGGGAAGVNDAGAVTGVAGSSLAFVYQNNVLRIFGTQAGSVTQGRAINASGIAVGITTNSASNTSSFARQLTGVVDFPPLSTAYAINDAGVIAGTHVNGSAVDAATYNGTAVTDLPTLGGNSGIGFGINNAGTVAGRARDTGGVDHAVYWSNAGVIKELSTKASSAFGINAAGQVVGSNAFSADGSIMHATVWQPDGTATDLTPTQLITSSNAEAINDSGAIVGYDGFATIWRNGVEQNLNTLIAPGSGYTLYDALDISNNGNIVGVARDSTFTSYAYLLTPIPEPHSLALVALGASLLLRRRRASKLSTRHGI